MTLVWASGYNGITDPDAQTYIAAVEAADGQALEGDVALAINDFVVGCKDDGIWDAIKASCILAGARTLSGALVPLKGTAPTNYNFVSGDYNRETGLVGNGSTDYLDTNRANNADPQNNQHLAIYASATGNGTSMGAGATDTGTSGIGRRNPTGFTNTAVLRSQNGSTPPSVDIDKTDVQWLSGLAGISRSSSTSFVGRSGGTNKTFTVASQVPYSANIFVFGRNSGGSLNDPAASRLSFYSIGEFIDLEKLDNRTTRLMNLISYSLASGLPDLSTMDIDAALYIGAVYRAGGTLS